MIEIISPDQYKIIQWKNGKGETTELAISPGGSIEYFDWRISIASVLENGPFSDFTGYMRNLVLIEGAGIQLEHDGSTVDRLDEVLTIATFDGSCKTVGTLSDGPITDFNVMTKIGRYNCTLKTYSSTDHLVLDRAHLCFIYSLKRSVTILCSDESQSRDFPPGYLIKISGDRVGQYVLSGQDLIVVYVCPSK